MKIVCDNCSTKYSIADEKVRGKVFKIKCKKCSHIIVVKGQEGGATASEGAPSGSGFDQKETRVFDYSGFDGQQPPAGASPAAAASASGGAATSAGGEPIWHLVIDREQVGPLTVAELQAKWAAGEADGDTYAWREGFGDWQRLAAIDELSAYLRGGAAAAPPPADDAGGGLFGGGDAQSESTSRADPADLFAAAAASGGGDDDGPGDLFGGRGGGASVQPMAASAASGGGLFGGGGAVAGTSSPARRSVPKEDLFADAGGGLGAVSAGANGGGGRMDVRPMTGQRNENSVLFSLSNLASLATETPKSSGSSGGGGGGGMSGASPGFTSGGGSEGSGLIDIRAMAAMTLGAGRHQDAGPRMTASEDDLPVFSANAFAAPAAGVLLPTVQPESKSPKWMFIAIIGLLAVIAIALVVFILTKKPSTTVAKNDTPTTASPGVAPPSNDPGVAPSNPVNPSNPANPSNPSNPANPNAAGTDPSVVPPVVPSDPSKPADATDSKPRDTKPRDTSPRDTKPRDTKPRDTKVESTTPVDTKSKVKCDDVACLVDPSLPCCKGGGSKPKDVEEKDTSLPASLSQSDIKAGVGKVNGKVMACHAQFKVPGLLKVKISISAEGTVTDAAAQGSYAGTPTGSCAEKAVRNAKFKPAQRGISVTYPFQLR